MTQPHVPGPGYPDQDRKRTVLRVVGALSMTAAVVMIAVGLVDFFQSFNEPLDVAGSGEPTKFWLIFLAMPFFLVGAACLNAGFLGAATRFGAGETMPVAKDSAAYLSDGRGILGVGRVEASAAVPSSGPFCRQCGTRNDEQARFCDSCGTSLA